MIYIVAGLLIAGKIRLSLSSYLLAPEPHPKLPYESPGIRSMIDTTQLCSYLQ